MSLSAVELLQKPRLLKAAKAEFLERKKAHDEPPLLPMGLKPPIELRWPEWVARPGDEWWIPPQ